MAANTNHDDIPDAWRQAAREEARAVYDDLAAEDSEGRMWNVESIITTFGITRRQALMTLALIATGVPILSAVTRAAGESWGNATGTEGTDSEPLLEVNAKQVDAQDIITESVDAGAVSISQVAAVANLTSNQTIPSGSSTQVNLENAQFEDTDVVDVDLPNDQLTIQVDGVYIVVISVSWNSDSGWSTGDRNDAELFVNGSRLAFGRSSKAGTGGENIRRTFIDSFSQNDNLDMRVFQDSGSSIDIRGGTDETRLEIARLG